MQKSLFAIYDRAAQDYIGPIHQLRSNVAAIRLFRDVYADPNSMIAKHPTDFALHQLGHLDIGTGELTPDFQVILTGDALAATQTTEKP